MRKTLNSRNLKPKQPSFSIWILYPLFIPRLLFRPTPNILYLTSMKSIINWDLPSKSKPSSLLSIINTQFNWEKIRVKYFSVPRMYKTSKSSIHIVDLWLHTLDGLQTFCDLLKPDNQNPKILMMWIIIILYILIWNPLVPDTLRQWSSTSKMVLPVCSKRERPWIQEIQNQNSQVFH